MMFMMVEKRCFKRTAAILAFVSLLQQGILMTPAFSQTSAKELLNAGVRQTELAQFEDAIKSLEQALVKGLRDKDDVIQAYKYIAFSAAALGDEAKAENAYVELLKRYPVFDLLLSDSPRLQGPFKNAKEKVHAWQQTPPSVEFEPPRMGSLGMPVELSARVVAAAGIDSVIFFCKRSTEPVYQKQIMVNTSGDLFSATLPLSDEPANWMLYLVARAKNGKATEWRSAGNPHLLAITATKKKGKLWLYAAIGAVVLGGGAAAALAGGGEETPPPATSNKLPDPPGTP